MMQAEKTLTMEETVAVLRDVATKVPFIAKITTEEQYDQAIALLDELTDNYQERNEPVMNMLFHVLHEYEEIAPAFAEFNAKIASLDPALAMLRIIMDQHGLTGSDFQNEIGSKSTVSKILNGHRKLTRKQIEALSKRFNLSPALFF